MPGQFNINFLVQQGAVYEFIKPRICRFTKPGCLRHHTLMSDRSGSSRALCMAPCETTASSTIQKAESVNPMPHPFECFKNRLCPPLMVWEV